MSPHNFYMHKDAMDVCIEVFKSFRINGHIIGGFGFIPDNQVSISLGVGFN